MRKHEIEIIEEFWGGAELRRSFFIVNIINLISASKD